MQSKFCESCQHPIDAGCEACYSCGKTIERKGIRALKALAVLLPLALCILLWVDQRRMVVVREKRAVEIKRIGVENEAVRTLSDGAARELTEAAAVEAMAEQEHLQERKLREVRQSDAYKLWKVSLEVQQGYNMTQRAKAMLARDSMSAAEKSEDDHISDAIFARQLMAAGAALVARTFPEYKELGGEAASPGAVIPGPDPFANYRTVQDGAVRRARFGSVIDYADDSPLRKNRENELTAESHFTHPISVTTGTGSR